MFYTIYLVISLPPSTPRSFPHSTSYSFSLLNIKTKPEVQQNQNMEYVSVGQLILTM